MAVSLSGPSRPKAGLQTLTTTLRIKTVKFEIRDHKDVMEKVLPHFDRFPLLSAKQKDFELFKTICTMIDRKLHLNKDGFAEILQLAYRMNGSGKRKRKIGEIVQSLR